jgi:hypothetical protein
MTVGSRNVVEMVAAHLRDFHSIPVKVLREVTSVIQETVSRFSIPYETKFSTVSDH